MGIISVVLGIAAVVVFALIITIALFERKVRAVGGSEDMPRSRVEISFGRGKVSDGETIAPEEAAMQPSVRLVPTITGRTTIAMVDIDAPSRANPTSAEFRHWLVSDAPVAPDGAIDVPRGDILTSYMGPRPPPGSGQHRYVIKVYAQSKKTLSIEEPAAKWSSDEYAKKNDLKLVGTTIFVSKA